MCSGRGHRLHEGLPFFKSFKCVHCKPGIDVSPPDGQFATGSYDNYGELLDKLIEHIPDFNMRRK